MLRHRKNLQQNDNRLSHGLLQIELTKRAKRALAMNEQELFVEMQLHFGCMLRKKVNFSNTPPQGDFMKVTQNMNVGLRTFMKGEACGIDRNHTDKELSDTKIGTPRWLMIDYKKGQWSGEFGLTEKPAAIAGYMPKWLIELISMIIKSARKDAFNHKITM